MDFLYLFSSKREMNELMAMEMRHIFKDSPETNYHITSENIDINRSTFFKGKVFILYFDEDIKTISDNMIQDDLHYDNYKIHYKKYDEVPYQTRLLSLRKLGSSINGSFSIKNPEVEFILTKIKGKWIFGILEKNRNEWLNRKQKPFNYSHALDARIAKAVLNIAIHNNYNTKLLDPCCGIGTVLIEGRLMGLDIKGYEINPLIKHHCNKNLQFFGLSPDVKKIDMLSTSNRYDAIILDLPYGHSSIITTKEQQHLIKKTMELSNKVVIIAMDNMSLLIENMGLTIIDQCKIKKSNVFSRYVFLCNT